MNAFVNPPNSHGENSPTMPPRPEFRRSALDRIEFQLACLVTFFSPMNVLRLESAYFTLSDVFAMLFCIVLAFNRSIPVLRLGLTSTMWATGVALLVVFLLVSSAFNGDAARGLIVSCQYFYAYVVLAFVFFTRTRDELLIMMKVFTLAVFITCIHGIYLIHIDGETNTHFVSGNGRLRSFVERSNEAAAVFAMTLPLLLYLKAVGRYSGIVAAILALSYLYAVILTGSNSGFLGWLFGLAVYSVVSMNWRVIASTVIVVMGLSAVAVSYGDSFLPEVFKERVFGALVSGNLNEAGSYTDRLDLIKEALGVINRSPFLGLGANQYAVHSELGQSVHNAYLLIWSEGGFPALLGFLLIITSAIVVSVRTFRLHGNNATFACSLSVTLLFAAFINSTPHVYGRFWVVPLLLVLALAWRFQLENMRTLNPAVASVVLFPGEQDNHSH